MVNIQAFGIQPTIFITLFILALLGLGFSIFQIGRWLKIYNLLQAKKWYILHFVTQLPLFLYLVLFGENFPNWFWVALTLIEAGILLFPYREIQKTILKGDFKAEFLSRNFGLIPNETQEKIKNSRVLLVGCGLGSQIAVLAARMGFEKFILCDGDKVELNNLNRQAFEITDIGKNKAEVTKRKILKINPNAQIKVYPKFVKTKEEVEWLVSQSDIIVNMADPDEAMYQINSLAQKQGKVVFYPLTFGFGGYVLVFSPQSISLETTVGGRFFGNEFFEKLVRSTYDLSKLSKNNSDFVQIYQQAIRQKRAVPQLGISTYSTSFLVVKAMIGWVEGLPMPLAPNPIVINPWK